MHDDASIGHPRLVSVVLDTTDARGPAEFYRRVPQQLHLDLTVPTREALQAQHARATELGARLRLDRTDDPEEPLNVYADPAGHPFCIFVSPPAAG